MPRTVTVGRRAAVAAGCQCSLPDRPTAPGRDLYVRACFAVLFSAFLLSAKCKRRLHSRNLSCGKARPLEVRTGQCSLRSCPRTPRQCLPELGGCPMSRAELSCDSGDGPGGRSEGSVGRWSPHECPQRHLRPPPAHAGLAPSGPSPDCSLSPIRQSGGERPPGMDSDPGV